MQLEKLFPIDSQHGISGLLASIAVLLALHLVTRVGSFLWDMKKEKDKLSEKTVQDLVAAVDDNTKMVEDLASDLRKFEAAVAELPKLKLDLRRLFAATRIIAGDEWPEIRDEIMRDEF